MSKPLRTCPECRSPLGSTPVQKNGKVRCPECGALLAAKRRDDSECAIQATAGNGRTAAAAVKTTPKDDDRLPPIKKNRAWVGLLVVGLGVMLLGFLGLAVLGSGIGLWLLWRPASSPVVATAEPERAALPAPPADKANPPANDQQLGQAKEPIKPAGGELPLDELKDASVYIKATTATMRASGSGFVVLSQGDTAYVVTNHHVISPPAEKPVVGPQPVNPQPFDPFAPPPIPVLPRPPHPIMPRRPTFPRPGLPIQNGALGPGGVELTIVFRSGTPQEQALKATVTGDDANADLAVLKVTGVRNVPAPIDCARAPKLKETMAVLAFGFPFGDKLDPKQKDPAITVTKGNVSALRLDGGELSEVQLDLDLNPGNSGGPIVDEKGALIGVAVAKITNSRIGFAVPVHKLHRLLDGRIDPPTTLYSITIQGQSQVRVATHVTDPLGKVRAPVLLYGSADELKAPAKGKDGWERLAGAKSSQLTIDGANGVAVLALTPPARSELKVCVQVSYQDASGQTIYGEPRTLVLGTTAAPPPPVVAAPPPPPPVAAAPTGPVAGEELTKLLGDLKAADEATRQKAADTLTKRAPKERLAEVKQGLQALLTAAAPATRTAGIKALAVCFPKEVPSATPQLLEDEAPPVRQAILQVIKERKDAHFAAAVAARLPVDGGAAADALKAMGTAAEKAVLPYLSDKNATARGLAFQVIKQIGAVASVAALEEALKGPDAGPARDALAWVRQRVPLTEAEWPQALDDLKAADAGIRVAAIRRISVTPPVEERRADMVSRCESLLNDQSGDVRAAAVMALARWGGKEAVPALAKRLEGLDPGFHAVVIAALAEIKDDTAVAVIAKCVLNIFDRAKAIEALKAMDPLVAEKAALPLLADPNVFARAEVCKVLADIGGRDSIAPLERLANAPRDPFCAPEAAKALAAIKARLESGEKK